MNYQQIAKANPAKLYSLRNSSNAKEIDALLDQITRNAAPKRKRTVSKGMMADYHSENSRWHVEDDGTIGNVPA